MDIIPSTQAREFLRTVDVGIWHVVYLPDKPPKFYADECMDALLGISAPVTAEECAAAAADYRAGRRSGGERTGGLYYRELL